MKALSICQPFAHLIAKADGDPARKRVENRTWPTDYRGPLAIHAGKSRDWIQLNDSGMADEQYGIPLADMAFGAIVATCHLVACIQFEVIQSGTVLTTFYNGSVFDLYWLRDHEHTEGPWCWVLGGMQKLFTIPDSLIGGAI